jgi:hypothetical protein
MPDHIPSSGTDRSLHTHRSTGDLNRVLNGTDLGHVLGIGGVDKGADNNGREASSDPVLGQLVLPRLLGPPFRSSRMSECMLSRKVHGNG